jgi:hypothetical protein
MIDWILKLLMPSIMASEALKRLSKPSNDGKEYPHKGND